MIIATVGPREGHGWQASHLYEEDAHIILGASLQEALRAVETGAADRAVIPVYNTREGEIKEFFQTMAEATTGRWVDNIVLPLYLSLGTPAGATELTVLVGTTGIFRQCEQYITKSHPDISLLAVKDLDKTIATMQAQGRTDWGVIDTENFLKSRGLEIRERELVSYNRTRYAVIGLEANAPTGYDATAIITIPLRDRLGLLYDMLGEFSRRGINILDFRSETDIKTQELKMYIEAEGHMEDKELQHALHRIETVVIQEAGALRPLGSYRRLEIRTHYIETFGFIGTGEMSRWFIKKLESEGYTTLLTGRNTTLRPEEMIGRVQVVVICVPISVTAETISTYGPLLRDGQALIILAGEAEDTLNTALAHTAAGVEVMLVHNLWGPQVLTMKDRLASVVRTPRSGRFCSEFEAFLYKHGAEIAHDTPARHDLLMGVVQKLPTTVSVALAAALGGNTIPPGELYAHATLTSLYGILAMSRIHFQNPRTYAEIMATKGEGQKIVRDFISHLERLATLSEAGQIEELITIIEANRAYLTEPFMQKAMAQALAVDQTLGKFGRL